MKAEKLMMLYGISPDMREALTNVYSLGSKEDAS